MPSIVFVRKPTRPSGRMMGESSHPSCASQDRTCPCASTTTSTRWP